MNKNKMAFDVEKMKRFVNEDKLIEFAFNDLIRKGHEEMFVLKIIYNSYILEDSTMEKAYREA